MLALSAKMMTVYDSIECQLVVPQLPGYHAGVCAVRGRCYSKSDVCKLVKGVETRNEIRSPL